MTWVQLLLVLGCLKNTWIPTIENLTGPGWVKGPAFHLGAIDVVSGGTRVGLVGSHDTCWHLLPAGEKMLGGHSKASTDRYSVLSEAPPGHMIVMHPVHLLSCHTTCTLVF